MNVLRLILMPALVMAALLMTRVPAVAHHSFAAFYDASQSVEVTGVIKRFQFRNPHSFIYLEVTDDQGQKVEWLVEMVGASNLMRRGWDPKTLKTGDVIKVVGARSKNPDTHGLAGAKLSKPDGSPVGPPIPAS